MRGLREKKKRKWGQKRNRNGRRSKKRQQHMQRKKESENENFRDLQRSMWIDRLTEIQRNINRSRAKKARTGWREEKNR